MIEFKTLMNQLSAVSPISVRTAKELMSATQIKTFKKGTILESSGQVVRFQFFVVEGIVRKFLTNAKGEDFTTDFFTSGHAITPALLRSNNYISFVNLEVISTHAIILCFSRKEMETCMQGNKDLESFGHKVLMNEAYKIAEREKILLTAAGLEKLEWFRMNYHNLENEIPHYYIASFLGITPTSFSRLRKINLIK